MPEGNGTTQRKPCFAELYSSGQAAGNLGVGMLRGLVCDVGEYVNGITKKHSNYLQNFDSETIQLTWKVVQEELNTAATFIGQSGVPLGR